MAGVGEDASLDAGGVRDGLLVGMQVEKREAVEKVPQDGELVAEGDAAAAGAVGFGVGAVFVAGGKE